MYLAQVVIAVVRRVVGPDAGLRQMLAKHVGAGLLGLDAEVVLITLGEIVQPRLRGLVGCRHVIDLGPIAAGGRIDVAGLHSFALQKAAEAVVIGRRRRGQADLVAQADDGDLVGLALLGVLLAFLLEVAVAAHIDVAARLLGRAGPRQIASGQVKEADKLIYGRVVFRIIRPAVERVAIDERPLRQLAAHRLLLEIVEQLVEHLVGGSHLAAVARVAEVAELELWLVTLETSDHGDLACRIGGADLQGISQRRFIGGGSRRRPLTVVERIEQAADLDPIFGVALARLGGNGLRLPLPDMDPIRRVLGAMRQRERELRGPLVVQLDENVARLSEHAIQRQVVFLVDAILDLRLVRREHHQIDVSPGRRLGLLVGDQGQPGDARLKIDVGVVPLPDDVLARAPAPGDLRLDPFAKGPNLGVLRGSVEAIEPHLAGLFDLEGELRLEAVSRFVPHKGEVTAGFGDLHVDGRGRCFRTVRLLRSGEERLPAQESIGEAGRVIVVTPVAGLPSRRGLRGNLEFLCFGDDRAVGERLHRLTGLRDIWPLLQQSRAAH